MDEVEEHKFYQFLPESISDHVKTVNKDRIKQLREGAHVSNLTKPEFVERDKNIAFDRFTNKGEAQIKTSLAENRNKIE